MARTLAPVSLLAALLGAMPFGIAPAIAVDAGDHRVEDAIDFRREFGLDHSEDFVQRTFDERSRFANTTWGVPLSTEEADELLRRVRNRSRQNDAVEYAKDRPSFGGLWFDQRNGGAAHYTFTANVAEHREAILAMAPDAADVHVSQADYRMSELESVKDEISRDMQALIKAAMPIAMIDANAERNRVIVYLAEQTDGAAELLRDRYGPSVVVERGSRGFPDVCNSRGDCRNPLKGGLRIVSAPTAFQCTSAFQAKKANGDRVMITAGHCINEASAAGSTSWRHNGNQFGVANGDTLDSSSVEADIGWIKIDGSEDVTPADQFLGEGASDIKSFGGQQPNSQQNEGDPICRSGEQSDWDCGVIKNDDVSKPNGEGQQINSVWTWSKDSTDGDSGGTMAMQVFIGGQAFWFAAGVHVHSTPDSCPEAEGTPNTCRSWYSTADQVENQSITSPADLTICLDSDC